jgi:hypothetical protein
MSVFGTTLSLEYGHTCEISIFTAAIMKMTLFWVIAPGRSLSTFQRCLLAPLSGLHDCCFHHQAVMLKAASTFETLVNFTRRSFQNVTSLLRIAGWLCRCRVCMASSYSGGPGFDSVRRPAVPAGFSRSKMPAAASFHIFRSSCIQYYSPIQRYVALCTIRVVIVALSSE